MTTYKFFLLILVLFGYASSSYSSDDEGDFQGTIRQQYYVREAWRMSYVPPREPMPQRPMTARQAWSMLKEPTWLDDPDPSTLQVAPPEFPETDYIDPQKGTRSDLLSKIKSALDLKRAVMFGIEFPTEFSEGPDPSGIMPMPAIYERGSAEYQENRLGVYTILAESYDDDKDMGHGSRGCLICREKSKSSIIYKEDTWIPNTFSNQVYYPYAFFEPSNDWIVEIWVTD